MKGIKYWARSSLLVLSTLSCAGLMAPGRAQETKPVDTAKSDSTVLPLQTQQVGGLVTPETAQGTKPVDAPRYDRAVLPLQTQLVGGEIAETAAKSISPTIMPVRAPTGAPNIVVVMLDDVGFGAAGTFGGPVATPVMDKLASQGLRYNQFNTTALCSPTRAALLTGRNHHDVGFGTVAEFASGFPGYDSIIPKTAATIAEVLKDNGYNTALFGKWHNTPVWETSAAGPFDHWPTHMGFQHFYGFMGAQTNQLLPTLFNDTTLIRDLKRPEGYSLTADLVNHALSWVDNQHAMAPNKPFFVYFAPGATHAPLQVPSKKWIEPYLGKFDQGWDKLREETFARQKKLGVIPADTQLTPRDPLIVPAWNTVSPEMKRFDARLMAVYAGFLAQTDYEVGRLVDGLKKNGTWDNTLFIYIVGDNGASPEGGKDGAYNSFMNIVPDVKLDPKFLDQHIDELGGAKFNALYPVGFAWAMDTPFKYTKWFASYFGGTRNPMIIDWPGHIKQAGGLRTQFSHVTDIYPTILQAAKLPIPKVVNGFEQTPLAGASLLYSLNDAAAPTRHNTQYFDIIDNRAIYHNGWIAAANHGRHPPGQDVWSLYNINKDFSENDNLAEKYPEKLTAMKAIFTKEAGRNQVFPLGLPMMFMTDRPSVLGKRTTFTLGPDSVGNPFNLADSILNRSYSIDAKLELPKDGAVNGVIVATGGYFGGFSLFVKDRKPMFTYNYYTTTYTTLAGAQPLPAGRVDVKYTFAYDGGGVGKGGLAKLFVNGLQVAEKRIPQTESLFFTVVETLDVGMDTGSPASDLYQGTYPFTAKIEHVTFNLK